MAGLRKVLIRRTVRRQLRALDVAPPLHIEDLCRRYADQRNRPIVLLPRVLPAKMSAITLVTDDADVILYQEATTRPHQQLVLTHELGHLMLGHTPDSPVDLGAGHADFWKRWMPNVPDSQIQGLLTRCSRDPGKEDDAETVAEILRGWATLLDHLYPEGFDSRTPRWVRGGLSERQGWL